MTHSSFDLTFIEQGSYIHLQWKGSQTLSTIQAGCKQLCELLIETGADKVLNDGRFAVGCWTASVPWIVYCFLPRARRAGMRSAAHVLSKERKSKMSAHTFRLFADFCEWNIAFFQTIQEAEEWLTCRRRTLSS
jgi:hypothetical protein